MSQLNHICNFLQLSDRTATAGQPTLEQFSVIESAGYKTVVNLALPTSTNALPNEKAIVEATGMQYTHIPVIWEQPTLADLTQFFQVMSANVDRPTFVHCALNMRVSVFMYLYRLLWLGVNEAEAQQDLHQIWTPNETWQNFIEHAIANADTLINRSV